MAVHTIEFEDDGRSVIDVIIELIKATEEKADQTLGRPHIRANLHGKAKGLREALEYIDAVFQHQDGNWAPDGMHGVVLRTSHEIIREHIGR